MLNAKVSASQYEDDYVCKTPHHIYTQMQTHTHTRTFIYIFIHIYIHAYIETKAAMREEGDEKTRKGQATYCGRVPFGTDSVEGPLALSWALGIPGQSLDPEQ